MDGSSFRKQVLLDLVSAPVVLFPSAAGLTLLLASWAVSGSSRLMAFAGVTGLLTGAGALITRWITSRDKIIKRVYTRGQARQAAEKERALDELAAQLERDGDPWTGQALATLRQLSERFRDLQDPAKMRRTPPIEIAGTVQRMLDCSYQSLNTSYKLWETSRTLLTKAARRELFEKREKLLIEVDQSITQIAKAIDGLHTLGLEQDPSADLADMRQELEENLDVARRVERRMHELESELNPGRRQRE